MTRSRWVQVLQPPSECWALSNQDGAMIALCAQGVGDTVWCYSILDVSRASRRIQGQSVGVSRHEVFEEIEGTLATMGANLGPTFIEPPPKS